MTDADRVVLITGATGGLGRIVAGVFAADGARLGLAGSDPGRLETLATDLNLAPDRWVSAIGDLRDRDAARAAVASVIERFGRIDILLHLVGGWQGGTAVVDLEAADLATMLDQHLWSTLNVVQGVLPGMIERGWGRIIAVSTPFASNPAAKGGSYAIAKAAEETLIRAVARDVAGTGVTANVVVVKAIDTAHARTSDPSPKNASWTSPEEIAAAMRYLCSNDAAAVNGARLPLDGQG